MKDVGSLRILHVVGSLDRTWGGLSLYVAELATELANQGHQVQVLCRPNRLEECWPLGDVEVVHARSGSKKWAASMDGADLVHVHGLWLPLYHQALTAARNRKKPRLLSVHGMLEPGALQFSRWKKRLALWLYQKGDLRSASALHATARTEHETLRGLGLRQPIITLPPGVWPPPVIDKPVIPAAQPRRALFLGRIHPKKGVLTLIEAWADVRPDGWRLDLAGPDEGNHLAKVKASVVDHRLEREVVHHGAVFGEAKERLLQQASLLVVPSMSENFGIVVAEALARGMPVITSTGTPWEALVQERCGWWVPLGVKPLVTALQEATSLAPEILWEMGRRGRNLAEREFAWPGIADRMGAAYSWLMGRTGQPECVELS